MERVEREELLEARAFELEVLDESAEYMVYCYAA